MVVPFVRFVKRWWYLYGQNLPWLLVDALRRQLLRRGASGQYGGILLADQGRRRWHEPEFTGIVIQIITDALHLIEAKDSLRYRRVQRYIDSIVNEILISASARYDMYTKQCRIDLDRYNLRLDHEHYEWDVARVASVIIHESTHGYLFFGHNVRSTRGNWERIERICHGEEVRFARRLGKGRYNYPKNLVRPFDPEDWQRGRHRSIVGWLREYWQRTHSPSDIR